MDIVNRLCDIFQRAENAGAKKNVEPELLLVSADAVMSKLKDAVERDSLNYSQKVKEFLRAT